LTELAREAGVSVPTVSKVLNGRFPVSRETRQRVLEAVDQHGYPRLSKPGKAVHRPDALELLFFELESTWAIQILWGVQQAAMENSCSVMISGMGGSFFPPDSWVEDVIARRSIGVIAALTALTDAQLDDLCENGIPVVALDPARTPPPDTPWISATNRDGAFTSTRHLLDLGHRRIAMVAGPGVIPCAHARLQGYRAAMAGAGAPVEGLVRSGNMNAEDGLALGRELLQVSPRPTAIVTTNDLQAMGVYEAAREARLCIPGDLSVVGFDDLAVAAWMAPGLTTVHQPLHEMAVAATDLALCLAWGTPTEALHRELAVHLVVRASTAPPSPG
jgi:LacI family xylobiose transport system transcriptional regulator